MRKNSIVECAWLATALAQRSLLRCTPYILLLLATCNWQLATSFAAPAEATPAPVGADPDRTLSFGVGWLTSHTDAQKLAQAMKSPLLLYFTADWCPPCKMMHDQTFADPRIQALLRRIVCLRIDIDKNHELALAWRVSGIPRLIVLNVAGQVIGDCVGFRSAAQLEPLLQLSINRATEVLPEAPNSPALAAQTLEQRITTQLSAAHSDGLTSAAIELFTLPKPELRAGGIELLLANPDRTKPVLFKLLADERLAIRVLALESLEKLGETKLDFDPWAPRTARTEALTRLQPSRRDGKPK